MGYQNIFKRYEMKYLVTDEQRKIITSVLCDYMEGDEWGKSTVCNLYFDTPDYLLIRRSIEKPVYKEKLRVRSYGTATDDSTVFIELKKKFKKVVYKRRISMKNSEAMNYLLGGKKVGDSQILRETDYFLSYYESLAPRVYISYEREAFYGKNDRDFRLTFDSKILWRQDRLSLCESTDGTPILPVGYSLMEIKTGTAVPLWLTKILTENKIYKTSFSKYGLAYNEIYRRNRGTNNDRNF